MNSLIVNGAQFCQDSDDDSNQEESQYLYPCAVGILILTTYNCLMEFVQLYRVCTSGNYKDKTFFLHVPKEYPRY